MMLPLAKAPPQLHHHHHHHLTSNLTFPPPPPRTRTYSQQQQHLHHHNHHHFGIIERKTKTKKKELLSSSSSSVVRAAYTRKPTGTGGAYELIDDDTGEKFFVWGGLDNDDPHHSSIPSKQVLSWKPSSSSSSSDTGHKHDDRGVESAADGAASDTARARTRIFTSSFGRLKAQHVRALIERSSHVKKENVDDCSYEGVFSNESDSSESEDEPMAVKANDTVLSSEVILDRNHSRVIQDYDTKRLSGGQIAPPRAHRNTSLATEPKVLSPRAASSLRGWNNAGSSRKSLVDSVNASKQRRGISTDGGFFSKKSFKDLGCSDDLIESLRGQLFLRPSHIQAMAFVPVTRGKSCIIADQSGSGKTLAYLAPVMQRLRQEELQGLAKSSSRSPHVVILVPTAELASQAYFNGFLTLWTERDAMIIQTASAGFLLEALKLQEETHISQFVMNLRPEFESVRFALMNREVSANLDTCFQEVLRIELRLNSQRGIFEEPKAFLAPLPADSAFLAASNQKPTQCYECKGFGHLAKNCRKKLVCIYCKRSGHLIDDCCSLQ